MTLDSKKFWFGSPEDHMFIQEYDATPFGSPYKMEYKLVPPDLSKDEQLAAARRLTDYLEKAIADAFNLPLFSLEQKQVDSTTKELVGEIASLKAEVATLNARDIENKKVIQEYDKLCKELEKTLAATEQQSDLYRKEAKQLRKRLGVVKKWTPVVEPLLRKPHPAAAAVEKIGKTPHAAWQSIVDNENDATRR